MIKKIVYVMSLNFSGSTVLSLLLSKLNNVYFVGEPAMIFKKSGSIYKHKEFCTPCKINNRNHQCPVWGDDQINDFRKSKDRFLEVLSTKIPDYCDTLIDSSKDLKWIRRNLAPQRTSSIIHITKPLHSWIASMKGRNRLKYPIEFYAVQWVCSNREIVKFANRRKLPYLHINYEEFAMDYRKVESVICEFTQCSINPERDMWSNEMHFIKGNPGVSDNIKAEKDNRKGISLDQRWMTLLTLEELEKMYSLPQARKMSETLGYSIPVSSPVNVLKSAKNWSVYSLMNKLYKLTNAMRTGSA